jgi:hypothetical protein
MAAAITKPRRPTDDELLSLAALAKIPEKGREQFTRNILMRLLPDIRTVCYRAPDLAQNRARTRAVHALHSARQALANLDESDREEFLYLRNLEFEIESS